MQVTCVADRIGVGVHFNPFVEWKDKVSIHTNVNLFLFFLFFFYFF